ncbi:hypothetical protein LSG23_20320 (plasmid) [Bacillus velezensis]|uniref:hypothetical protein n=1 Tax=Bacillus velezensis TaxID=492670 RepID=UPI0009881928|nr:hypothetical protein [Bacillus velezensis]AQS42448.1 hypothetical protein BVH55_00180 [Bacillus velezensis]WNR83249.1 hypothetical protein RP314_20530 [Bacillus velezensis]
MIVIIYYGLIFCTSGIFFYSLWNRFLTVCPIKVNGKPIVDTDKPSEVDLIERIEQTSLTLRAFIALLMGVFVSYPMFYLTDSIVNTKTSIIDYYPLNFFFEDIFMIVTGVGLFNSGIVYLLLLFVFIVTLAEHIFFRLKFKARRFAFEEEEKERQAQIEYENKYKKDDGG